MIRSLTLALVVAALAAGCSHLGDRSSSADSQFDQLTREFLSSHFAFRPLDAVGLGWHQFDGQFVVPDQNALAAEMARLKHYDRAFAALPESRLTPAHRYDLAILRSAIAGQRWTFETQRPAFRNPMFYACTTSSPAYWPKRQSIFWRRSASEWHRAFWRIIRAFVAYASPFGNRMSRSEARWRTLKS